jgi:hypothetical protein
MTTYSDALDRETAWLTTVDALPALLTVNGGPFDIVQARRPRTPTKSKRCLYVTRQPGMSAHWARTATGRTMATHHLRLEVDWPITVGTGSAETEQLNVDQAIDLVITRVLGPLGDKTHGGRFLSVAEDTSGVDVDADDPATAISRGRFTARITYHADDPELTV